MTNKHISPQKIKALQDFISNPNITLEKLDNSGLVEDAQIFEYLDWNEITKNWPADFFSDNAKSQNTCEITDQIFYQNTFAYYNLLGNLIFPKQNELIEEYVMINIAAKTDLFDMFYDKPENIKKLAYSKSMTEILSIEEKRKKEWAVAIQIFNILYNIANNKDKNISSRASLNVAAFLLEKQRTSGKIKNIYSNEQNQKKIWRKYKPFLHFLLVIGHMKEAFEQQKHFADFENYIINQWHFFINISNNIKEKILNLKNPKTNEHFILPDEISSLYTSTDIVDISDFQIKQINEDDLSTMIKEYKAPIPGS